ncbi:glutamate synthase-related protein [Bacillus sp. ISL-34]|uniref:glutamate synthase-related protein n=1 Tax=Bacillus sp. ISL-34 TaxID=2819121 RepID=UPI002852EB50|nr:glutamate synthase-related protein [Bacillus sp. ISL-34]
MEKYGVHNRVKIIASGKLFTPDRIAIALPMGADLVNIARGFMIAIGCIQTMKCQPNACPVGVATTDPEMQKALVIDEKKYHVVNFLVTLRKGLFRISAAVGWYSPIHFQPKHISYKADKGIVTSLEDIMKEVKGQIGARNEKTTAQI